MKNIGVFFGGKNPEHDVSIITGQLIISGLLKLGYQVTPIYIDIAGVWYTGNALKNLKFFTSHSSLQGLNRLQIDLEASQGKLVLRKKGFFSETLTIDVAFPALHGQYGEDGTIQGLFEMIDVPYVGCGVAASALAMDKVLTKQIYLAEGIPSAKFIFFMKQEWENERERNLDMLEERLRYPVFIKPARLGSSIGITKAKNKEDMERGLDVAFHYDVKVLVEEAVAQVMDVTCSVIGLHDPKASLLQESTFDVDFLSYDDKYLREGGTQLGGAKKSIVIPASLDADQTKDIQRAAIQIFKLFELSGMSRVDFLYNSEEKKWYANEINTLPGTLYHHLWKESGIEFPELLTRLLQYADEKYLARNSVTRTFTSKLMDLAKSTKLKMKGSEHI
jgi:D-alanine-D-alanine ligase